MWKTNGSCPAFKLFPFPLPYLRPRQWGWVGGYPQALPFGSTTPYPEPHCEIIDIAIFIMGVYALGYNLQRQRGWGTGGLTSWPVFHPISVWPWPYFPVLLCFVQIYCELVLSCRLSAIVYVFWCHAQGGLCSCLSNERERDVFISLKELLQINKCLYLLSFKLNFRREEIGTVCSAEMCLGTIQSLSMVLKRALGIIFDTAQKPG